MASKTVKVSIKGISPLLMHSYPLVPIENPPLEKRSIEEQAELAAYRDPDKNLYVPAEALFRALIGGSTYSKGKGRASLQKAAAASLSVTPLRLLLGLKTFAIDSRRVVIPATKGAVIRHRPIFEDWQLSFNLSYDDSLLTEKQARGIVDDTGSRVGILEYRPERKGPFGRFMVTHWVS
jgi:hypothetical protein